MSGDGEGFGPWVSGLSVAERRARWRAMRCAAVTFCGAAHPFVVALCQAEHDRAAARRALALLDTVAPLPRRRLLSVYLAAHQAARSLIVPKPNRTAHRSSRVRIAT